MYDFKLDRLAAEIRRRRVKRVFIQLPEGLKAHAREIADALPCETVVSGDPCFGACDTRRFPAALTVHFGHNLTGGRAGAGKAGRDVIYIEAAAGLGCTRVVQRAVVLLPKKVGLVTTAQHLHELRKAREVLEAAGKHVFMHGNGQVLGCDLSNAVALKKADAILFIGSGLFHPLGIAHATKKKTVRADPYTGVVEAVDASRLERDRWLRICKAAESRSFGVVLSTKPGQLDLKAAGEARKRLEKSGKKAYLVAMDEISPERLDYLPFDAFVITACPRIVVDDWRNYKKPILLPSEI